MNTEQRRDVRGALISVGFSRYYSEGDEDKCRIISAVNGVHEDKRAQGAYTELFKHADGTVVSVSWTAKSHLPWRNC
jgi:hypothetical protein